jgi:hypothetical protein
VLDHPAGQGDAALVPVGDPAFSGNDTWTRAELLRARGYDEAVVNGNGTGPTVDDTVTVAEPPSRTCEMCGAELSAGQARFCGRTCGNRAGGKATQAKAAALRNQTPAPAATPPVQPTPSPAVTDEPAHGLDVFAWAALAPAEVTSIGLANGWYLGRRPGMVG